MKVNCQAFRLVVAALICSSAMIAAARAQDPYFSGLDGKGNNNGYLEPDEIPAATLAVDPESNSLVVTAPAQLTDEVEALSHVLDEQGAQSTHVITLNESSPSHVHDTLRRLLGNQMCSGSSSPRPSGNGDRRR